MKSPLWIALSVLTCSALFGCATTDYVGQSYAPTEHVDIYFSTDDVERQFTVMGTAKTEGTEYLTFEAIEQQLVTDAMARGADAIVIDGMDTITVGSTSNTRGQSYEKPRYVVTQDGKIRNVGGTGHYDEISTTTDIRDKVMSARLIKYQ